MGVGIYLRGRYGKRSDEDRRKALPVLRKIEKWLEETGDPLSGARLGHNQDERPTLFLNFHPSAEEVEISLPGPGRMSIRAKTSTTGPGYHIFLCKLFHRMGKALRIRWQLPNPDDGGDSTGYFYNGDAESVNQQMLIWLRTVALLIPESLQNNRKPIRVNMPTHRNYPEDGPVITPLGSRDLEWVHAVIEDPFQGIDIFPWWEPGLEADFYLGRALTEMWQNIRWEPPEDIDEYSLLMSVHLDLCQAHDLDSTLDYPWREWAQLIQLIEGFNQGVVETLNDEILVIVKQRSSLVSGPLIGYCRKKLEINLRSGWSLQIPGSMIENWTPEGVWYARDRTRAVWFCWWELQKEDGSRPGAQELIDTRTLPMGEVFSSPHATLAGKAVLQPHSEDGKSIWNLMCFSAIEGNLAMLNIFYEKPADHDWALEVWRSLVHQPDQDIES